jgi:GDSL-like Lipase/Acylhydrolase
MRKGTNATHFNANSGNIGCDVLRAREKIDTCDVKVSGSITSSDRTKPLSLGETEVCGDLTIKEELCALGGVKIKSLDSPPNMYILGPSSTESGNFAVYYPNVVTQFVPVNSKINKRLIIVNGLNDALNQNGTFSDGKTVPEYISEKLGYKLYNSNEIQQLPAEDCTVVNYAVAGATALGNNENVPNNGTPRSWATVAGPHGLNAQLAQLLSHIAASGKVITDQDVVYLDNLGGNDMGAILTTGAVNGGPAAIAASAEFLGTIITIVQTLYNAGFRHVYMTYFGSDVMDFVPFVQRLDAAAPGTAAAFKALADSLFLGASGLLELLANQAAATMPQLHLSTTSLGSLGIDVFANRSVYGVRDNLITDPDPRGSPPAAPFPTQLDILAINSNRDDKNVLFVDDFHFTQVGQKIYADFICRFISVFTTC